MRERHEGQCQRGIAYRRAEDCHQHQRQQQAWQRQHDVDDTHDDVINDAAEVTGNQAEYNAHDQRQHNNETADQQRQARAVHQTRQHVAAHVIGTQQVRQATAILPRRRREQRIAELVRRIIRCEEVRKHRNQDHDYDIHQPYHRAFIALEVVPEFLQRRHRNRCSDHFILSDL